MSDESSHEDPDFGFDPRHSRLLRHKRHIADVRHNEEDDTYTVFPVVPELSHVESVTDEHLGLALLEFANSCRSDPAAQLVLGLH